MSDTSKTAKIIKKMILFNSTLTVRQRCRQTAWHETNLHYHFSEWVSWAFVDQTEVGRQTDRDRKEDQTTHAETRTGSGS